MGTVGHMLTSSRFGATFGAAGGGPGLRGVGGAARGDRGAPDPFIYSLKWPPHRADHFEVPM